MSPCQLVSSNPVGKGEGSRAAPQLCSPKPCNPSLLLSPKMGAPKRVRFRFRRGEVGRSRAWGSVPPEERTSGGGELAGSLGGGGGERGDSLPIPHLPNRVGNRVANQ